MRWITIRQLKGLRRLPVPPEALQAGRRRLMIVMAEAPMASGRHLFRAYIWKPALAAFVIVIFVAASGGGAVYAAQTSLPGDSLYAVKMVSESFQEHLTLSAERRFAVQAEHASRRLDETRQLLEKSGLDAKEREVRVRKAITGYEDRLSAMNDLAATLAAAPPKPGKSLKTIEAAERVLDRHAELVASATASAPDVVETVLEPIDDSIRMEADVFTFTHRFRTDDATNTEESDGGRIKLDAHRKERGDALSGHLKMMRAGLLAKPLEIKAEK